MDINTNQENTPMRDTIDVKGAKEHNLQNIDVQIPREKLVVITGVSGSGKSSLAFDTVYAEGQRRFLESLSTYAKRFVSKVKKPNVDFVMGLSPVISIEQKTITQNPRSTVGTMTDLHDYLRILFATIGKAHCPYCNKAIPTQTPRQMLEHMRSLPRGTCIEIRAPLFKIYGEDYPYLFADTRSKGYRRVYINDKLHDISDDIQLDENQEYHIEALIDRFFIKGDIDKQVLASLEQGLLAGEGFLSFHVVKGKTPKTFYKNFACSQHQIVMGEPAPGYFSFNDPTSHCATCLGLGTTFRVHPDLLVPDKTRSIKGGAFVHEAFHYDKNTGQGRIIYSLSQDHNFSLDTPFQDLPKHIVDLLFFGTKGKRFKIQIPPNATTGHRNEGRMSNFGGIINRIQRRYRMYRKEGFSHNRMENYLRKVMVEHICPDCNGTRLKKQRLQVTIQNKTIHDLGDMHIEDLIQFLNATPIPPPRKDAGTQIVTEAIARLQLLLDIGLDYLNLNRRASTLSGGESQRIRLSTQIGSGLMGMLYVLDEPSIGLHPKDNAKMITTLQHLRDIGNSVIVVEHDEDTIRAADHIIEIGPGPGTHGGHIIAEGPINHILQKTTSLTGQYLSGKKHIAKPKTHRKGNGKTITIQGARANNLNNIDVEIPLGIFTCITGTSGSGKSTLIHDVLFKKLYNTFHDSRVLFGDHYTIEGISHISDVINIDQSPIGRSSRSNPATYIGFYDTIRQLFAQTPEAEVRGYTPSRFSFNVKDGRCEACGGEGIICTRLQFLADVETECSICKGARYNEETLEITYQGKNIAEILDMSIEEGVAFFAHHPRIAHKLTVLNDLGLGYLILGHPAPYLSGGEAQRIKLAHELGKIKRGKHNLYILDEPTTGLHLADIQRLLDCLNGLVDAGHTVVVIEHHLDVIKTADWVIDLGPDGGHNGGNIMAVGPPEIISKAAHSHTGQFLKTHLSEKA